MNRQSGRANKSQTRNGVVTVMVLVVLLLMSALVAEFVRRAVSDRRQMRRESLHQQTMHLANAGVNRFRDARLKDRDYAGEVWDIPSGVIHPKHAGQVRISVTEEDATITARYPWNSDTPIQVTRTVRVSQ